MKYLISLSSRRATRESAAGPIRALCGKRNAMPFPRAVTAFAAACALATGALTGALTARAAPIAGMTYVYDLSRCDPNTTICTTPHASADDTTMLSILTDGNLGSLVPLEGGTVVFNNGTYAGFRNDGFGGASQPGITIDLHGSYTLNSFVLHYLVEDGPAIYAPQPIPNGSGGFLFDALTVYDYSDGAQGARLGSTNEFVPVFGLNGDFGSGATEVRTATINLGGVSASKLFVDVHTPYSFIFLSEIVVDAASSGPNADFDNDSDVDGHDFLAWQRGYGIGAGATKGEGDADGNGLVDGADLNAWNAEFGGAGGLVSAFAVPEPASIGLWLLALVQIARSAKKQ